MGIYSRRGRCKGRPLAQKKRSSKEGGRSSENSSRGENLEDKEGSIRLKKRRPKERVCLRLSGAKKRCVRATARVRRGASAKGRIGIVSIPSPNEKEILKEIYIEIQEEKGKEDGGEGKKTSKPLGHVYSSGGNGESKGEKKSDIERSRGKKNNGERRASLRQSYLDYGGGGRRRSEQMEKEKEKRVSLHS